MSQLPFHPAVGFGDLLPGWFAVPQNPVRSDGTPLVPSIQATAPGKAIKLPSLSDLVAGSFVVPQNPLIKGPGMAGLGCGCGGGCGDGQFGSNGGANYYALNGLGDLGQVPGTDPLSQALVTYGGTLGTTLADTQTFFGITFPLWGWLGLAGAGIYAVSELSSGRSGGRKRNPRRRNESISEGYYNKTGFHPIRSADDYDPEAVGEARAYAKRRKR